MKAALTRAAQLLEEAATTLSGVVDTSIPPTREAHAIADWLCVIEDAAEGLRAIAAKAPATE